MSISTNVFMRHNLIGNMPTRQHAVLPIATKTPWHDNSRPFKNGKSMAEQQLDMAACGRRLRAFRKTLGFTKSEMADRLNVDRTNYGRFESGARMIPTEIAFRISQRYPISMDWLYSGKMDGLSMSMADALRDSI